MSLRDAWEGIEHERAPVGLALLILFLWLFAITSCTVSYLSDKFDPGPPPLPPAPMLPDDDGSLGL